MRLIRLYRHGGDEDLEARNLRDKLSHVRELGSLLESVIIETCFWMESEIEFDDNSLNIDIIIRDIGRLKNLLQDSWVFQNQIDMGISDRSMFGGAIGREYFVEIGPRLHFKTAFSTNCISIWNALHMPHIVRFEQSKRYMFIFHQEVGDYIKDMVVGYIHDPMTQMCYPADPVVLAPAIPLNYIVPLIPLRAPQAAKPQWGYVDVMQAGRQALLEANQMMGLGFDNVDISHYHRVFRYKIKRNPTTIELFDLAQSHSEHSRHWFFKGSYKIDGKLPDVSLFDMVMDTNPTQEVQDPKLTDANSVIKFADNSSCIYGYKLESFVRGEVMTFGRYRKADVLKHIVFTAETHNFPTGLEPFSGANTGTGGRIRDVQAVGRGGWTIAGTAGYCVGNLRIPGRVQRWESDTVEYPGSFASPLEILIEASNGASDYGNKFGEPVICGFTRSFGQICGIPRERREWIKPIMFSGGIGTLNNNHVKKSKPQKNDLVVKIGGPAYRIGVGGGSASSVMVQGGMMLDEVQRNYDAVQRGDPEMGQKLNRVIRGCLELEFSGQTEKYSNPIQSIHDQGAGGNGNVLKEIVDGKGAVIFCPQFSVGDDTLSTLELWVAEYQESNAVLVRQSDYKYIERIAHREKCPIDMVGFVTDDETITLVEDDFDIEYDVTTSKHPVQLHLPTIMDDIPKKHFRLGSQGFSPVPLIARRETVEEALMLVLRLPSVGCKRYLTSKVDRSVTGLIAQQQCVGPLHLPVADVAVVALDYFSVVGAATSIGEQPIKMLINPRAGARLTVLEALTNLCACAIEKLEKVKCSANWMYAAKLSGEGHAMWHACKALCEIMKKLKIGIDGGKDSLSMAAKLEQNGETVDVKAPGSLVISAYAPVPDVYRVVTPDLKKGLIRSADDPDSIDDDFIPAGMLYLLKPGYCWNRIGGSAFAQVHNNIGCETPDVTDSQIRKFVCIFNILQKLINERRILAMHDVSDGGLITCLIEMAVTGYTGIRVDLPSGFIEGTCDNIPLHLLAAFCEEPGWVIEVDANDTTIMERFTNNGIIEEIRELGHVAYKGGSERIIMYYEGDTKLDIAVKDALALWDYTSFEIEKLQINKELAECERETMMNKIITEVVPNFQYNPNIRIPSSLSNSDVPSVAVIREEGCNGDREMAAAFYAVGFQVYDVTMWDLINNPTLDLAKFNGIVFPGGFSYADVLGSGTGWAAVMNESRMLLKAFRRWRELPNTFSLGVCNGCQLMAKMGWINIGNPVQWEKNPEPVLKLVTNDSGRFESRWVQVKVSVTDAIMLQGMDSSILSVWVAHGEGKFTYKQPNMKNDYIRGNTQIALRYVNDHGKATTLYPYNPNGSEGGIAGICSYDGRHLAIMPHPERSMFGFQCPDSYRLPGLTPWSAMFRNAYNMCTGTSDSDSESELQNLDHL